MPLTSATSCCWLTGRALVCRTTGLADHGGWSWRLGPGCPCCSRRGPEPPLTPLPRLVGSVQWGLPGCWWRTKSAESEAEAARRARERRELPPDEGLVPRAITALVEEIPEVGGEAGVVGVPVLVLAGVVDLPARFDGGAGFSSGVCL